LNSASLRSAARASGALARLGVGLALLLVAAPAVADDPPTADPPLTALEARGLVAEALLLESGAGDYRGACDKFRELLSRSDGLPDILVSEALLRLGLAHEALAGGPENLVLEQADRAEAAFQELLDRFPTTRWADDARHRLRSLEEHRKIVPELPTKFRFDEDVGGLYHARSRRHKGRLEHETADGEGVAAWRSYVIGGEDDLLMVRFAQKKPRPLSVKVRVSARNFPAHLTFFLVDVDGVNHATKARNIRPEEGWVQLTFTPSDFSSLSVDRSAKLGDRPIRYLMIQDVTGHSSTDRGENVVLFDDLEVF